MIQTLSSNNTISDMNNALSSDGVIKIDNCISGQELKSLHDEILDKCTTQGNEYEFGMSYRGPSLGEIDRNSSIFTTYNKEWMYSLYRLYSKGSQQYGMNIFATHDFKFTGELARNGWLHFDRLWRLKFFIYLTNIDKSSGAFSCSVGSHKKGKQLREDTWKNTNEYEEAKNRIELDYPKLLEIYPPEPIEASAGTLIVFDTDTFHKGGKVEEGKERLIVRLHCG